MKIFNAKFHQNISQPTVLFPHNMHSPQYVCSAQPQTSHQGVLIYSNHQTVQLSSHLLEWGWISYTVEEAAQLCSVSSTLLEMYIIHYLPHDCTVLFVLMYEIWIDEDRVFIITRILHLKCYRTFEWCMSSHKVKPCSVMPFKNIFQTIVLYTSTDV